MRRLGCFVLLLTMVLGGLTRGSVTRAQEGVSLNGIMEDQSSAVIAGGRVTLVHRATGETRKTVSDDAGQFTFSSTAPGEYLLKGMADGFEPAERTITVGTKPLKNIKVKMQISISEEVTITGSQAESSDNNADAVNLGSSLLGYLPAKSEDMLSVVSNFLSPAAMGPSGPSILVDGVETTDLTLATSDIKTVTINRSPYSTEYKRPGLARIEIVTKSGTRKNYDGDTGFSLRNNILNARNAFAVEKPELDYRLFYANLIGPVPLASRTTSFFLSGSRLIDDQSAVVNAITLDGPIRENVPTFKRRTTLLGRIDIKPNKLNRINFTYNFFDQPQRNRGIGGLKLEEQGIDANSRGHKFQAMVTTTATNLFNTFRFSLQSRKQRVGNLADEPTIKVRGAFTGGPSATARLETDTRFELQNVAVYSLGTQTLTFGGGIRPKFSEARDATNFNGTFTFANLSDFAASQPILFRIVSGNPGVSFSQYEAYGFFQDEFRLSKQLNLMLGLRYDLQSTVKDHNNFAPRFAVAYAPGEHKTVFRGGAGIFYDRLPDSAIQRSLLIDGVHTRELVIEAPPFPNPVTAEGEFKLPSLWRLAPDLAAPYVLQANFAVERRLGKSTQLSVDYQTLRGVHLFRTRNINAPFGESAPLPNPNFDLVNQVESSANLRSNALAVTVQGGFFKHFRGISQYTLSRITDDADDEFDLPANNYDLRPERGRAVLDKRHRVNLAGLYSYGKGWRVSGLLSLATGTPYNITTGSDDNGDGEDNDRPPGVIRNTGLGPGFFQMDLRLTRITSLPSLFGKEVRPGKSLRNVDINLDVYNVFNRNNLSEVIGEMSSATFGKPTASLQARTFQLSLRYRF